MARPKQRLVAVYKFFRNNPLKFNEFLEIPSNDLVPYKKFVENLEQLLYDHIEEPDLRFGQHMYNNRIVTTDGGYFIEEGAWLIGKEYVPPQNLAVWGTWGLQIKERIEAWKATKPVLNSPLTSYEKDYLGYSELKNYEVYARRYLTWEKAKPTITYKLLKDLDTEHIKNILITETHLSPAYIEGLKQILAEREGTPPPLPITETLKVLGVSVKCEEDGKDS